ncbi:MAG TPA: hypothetical protein VFC51_03415 [Chloroflexota bacterium]|nr:hypothetical protein [Chloroflexota bacterium]
MYTERIIHVPAVGKGPELRAALEARNATGNKAAPHALSVHMFAPQPGFVHSIRFENLAAIEAYMAAHLPSPEESRKIDQCLARERAVVLYEELDSTPLKATPKFLIRNRYQPSAGNGPELRNVLAERLQKGIGGAVAGAGLSRQIGSLDGPALAVTMLFASMADMDAHRAANASDRSFQPYLNKVASLCRAPMQQRIQRIIAPFPS